MRARITVTDVVYLVMALAALAGLYPVYDEYLGRLAGDLGPGELTAFETILPAAAIVLLVVILVEARAG